jgi:hypothetical protein
LIDRFARTTTQEAQVRRAGRVRAAAAWPLALVALGAVAADAARLVDVRVGRHPDFVRVVFETDAPAAFVLEEGAVPGESRVRIDAGSSGAVSVPPGAGAEVTLEPLPDGATLARIRAAAPVRVESQVLDRPPRIVFDLVPGADEDAVAGLLETGTEAEPTAPGAPGLAEPAEQEPSAPEPAAEEPSAVGDALPEAAQPAPPPALAPEVAAPSILSDLAPPLAAPQALDLPEPPSGPAAPPEEPPARQEPPLRADETPAASAPVTAPRPEPEPETPAVSAPPPAALVPRLDDRSLLLGAAGGLAFGLGVALLARGRRRPDAARTERALPEPVEAQAPSLPPLELAPEPEEEPPVGAAAGEPAERAARPPLRTGPWPESEPLTADLLVMIQRLDERMASAEDTIAGLVERSEQLERRGAAAGEELAAQRVALARLDVALGRPLARSDPARSTEPSGPVVAPSRPS